MSEKWWENDPVANNEATAAGDEWWAGDPIADGGAKRQSRKSQATAADYLRAVDSGLAQGISGIAGGIGTFIQDPAANALSGVSGAAAAADRGVTWAINALAGDGTAKTSDAIQENAQTASRFAAESRAAQAADPSNLPARFGLMLQKDSERANREITARDKATNPELGAQQQNTGQAEGFWDNLAAIKDNPLAFTNTMARSLPDMAAGFGAASAAHRAGAGLARVGTVGTLSEAGSSAMQSRQGVYQQVNEMPLETLAKSPRYQAVLAQTGGNPEQAREILANELADQVPLLAGAGTALGTVLTNKLFGGDATAKTIAGVDKMGAREFGKRVAQDTVEELVQGLPEDAVQHGATVQADPSQKYDPAGSAAQNMAAGFAMGAGGHSMGYARENLQRADKAPAPAPNADKGLTADVTYTRPDGSTARSTGTSPPADTVATGDTDAAEKALKTPVQLTALDRADQLGAELKSLAERQQELDPANGYGPAFDAERQDLATKAAELGAERDDITKTWPAAQRGTMGSFTTEAGARLEAQYALMDAADLVTSHDEGLRVNPLFPQEMQPRDRSRQASELQVASIVQKLDPARLGLSADAANGAPIVGADGLVESGNARTIALKRVYQANGQKAQDYKQFLRDNAAQFGLAPEAVESMGNPVLVRVRATPVNRAEFARQANASTVQEMGPSEKALSDAKRLTTLEGLNPDDQGDFDNSTDFIRQFMATLPVTEQSGMIESDGRLSTAGYRRIQNAVLARAYGDSPSLRRMTESRDNNLLNISKALVRVAPVIAAARERMQAGTMHEADIAPDLLAAVEGLSSLKDKGWKVADELGQADLTGPKYSPESAELLTFLADNARSPRRIAEFFQRYYEALEQAGDPTQPSMFGDEGPAPTRAGLLKSARGEPAPAPIFDFSATEQSLTAERDATENEIEDGWLQGGERRRKTRVERAVERAVNSVALDAENAREVFDIAAPAGRMDLAEYAVQRAENYARTMLTEPGVSKDSPKYEAIKKDLDRRKTEAVEQAAELRRDLNEQKKQQGEQTNGNTDQNAQRGVAGEGAQPNEKDGGRPQDAPRSQGRDQSNGPAQADAAGRQPEQPAGTAADKDVGQAVQQSAPAKPAPALKPGDAVTWDLKGKTVVGEVVRAPDREGAATVRVTSAEAGAGAKTGGVFSVRAKRLNSLPKVEQEAKADKALEPDLNKKFGAVQDGKARVDKAPVAPPLELSAPTPADITAKQDAAEAATKQKAKDDAKAEADAKKARDDKDIAARQDASAENFTLGQSAEDSLSGQGDVFGSTGQPPAAKKDGPKIPTTREILAQETVKLEPTKRQQSTPYGEFATGEYIVTVEDFGDDGRGVQVYSVRRTRFATSIERASTEMLEDAAFDKLNKKAIALFAANQAERGQGAMFSRATADVRNLVTLHNLTEDNLLYADRMGGIPVPSIGITKVDSPFGGFGNITLIAPKGMIDPKVGVPVYDRDAWTARFPTMNFKKVKASKADALYERIKGVRDLVQDDDGFVSQLWEQIRNASVQTPDKVTSLFTRYAAPRALYAQQVLGKTVKVPTRAVTRTTYLIGHDKELIAYWKKNGARFNAVERETSGAEFPKTPEAKGFDEAVKAAIARYADTTGIPDLEAEGIAQMMPDGGVGAGVRDRLIRDFETFGKKEVDRAALVQAIDKIVKRDDPGYLRWVEGLVKPLFDEPTITLRGREVAPTLENIVDAMTVGATAGAEKSMTFSTGKVAAMLGKQFKSLDEIKAARDQVVSAKAETEGKKATDALLNEYRTHVSQFYGGKDWRGNIDTWAANDDSMEALAKAGKLPPSDASIKATLARMNFQGVDQQSVDMAREAIAALRNAATDYFEAKPQRAVTLDEFKGAVVPKGTSAEAIAILEKHGISVEIHGKAEGAREKAIQKLAKRLDRQSGDVLFSFAGAKAETADLMSLTVAQDRVAAGDDAETVRMETGWHNGVDGKWRFEIADNEAKLLLSANQVAEAVDFLGGVTVGDVLDHPKLFAAYPALAQIPLDMREGKGASLASASVNGVDQGKTILMGRGIAQDDFLSVLLHELQHGIQKIEGFASGGSMQSDGPNAQLRSSMEAMVQIDELARENNTTPTEFARLADYPDRVKQQVAELDSKGLWDANIKDFKQSLLDPRQRYLRLAGEVEARNTQKRKNITDLGRKLIPPSQTADVKSSDVIIVFNGKEMEDAPTPANAGGNSANTTDPNARNTATQLLVDQSTAEALNASLVRYGLGQDWSNAYAAVKLPDALSGVRDAIQAAFGRDVRSVAPTAARFDLFNGIYLPSQPGAVYVNAAASVGFVNIAGHELWHVIKRERPGLIDWYRQNSRQFYKDLPAYQKRLNKLVQPGEKQYDALAAEEELEADFMGDSLADPVFLQQLADASPNKFRSLLNSVQRWLAGVVQKLRAKGLGSSQEVSDVEALRGYLKEVLVAFAEGRALPDAPQVATSQAAREESNAPAFSFAESAGEKALAEFAKADELFALPKSTKDTVEGIVADQPGDRLEVSKPVNMGGRMEYTLTMPDGTKATLSVRDPNPFGGEQVYDSIYTDEGMELVAGRPGENPEDVPPTGDVWIDVSALKKGDFGAKMYNIAATYAHNTGRIFIGDPHGLSKDALRRRLEQMLSSALKFGTTAHLAPHPDQVRGGHGVPPLRWVYGDHVGNVERMIAASVKALDNGFPTSNKIAYDPDRGFYRTDTGTPMSRGQLAGMVGQSIVRRRAVAGAEGSTGQAGWRTVSRAALFRYLQSAGGVASEGGQGRGRLLARGGENVSRLERGEAGEGAYSEKERIFYSRAPSDGITNDGQGQADSTNAPARLSRTEGAADQSGMPVDELQALADRIAGKNPRMPKVNVLSDPSKAPKALRDYITEQGAENDVDGAMHEGELYLFASGLPNVARAEHVLLEHEAAHFGLRAILGDSLTQAMNLIYANNGAVRRAATEMQRYGKLSNAAAVEEAIVDIPSAQLARLKGWRRVTAMARDWLAAHGFSATAAKLSTWLDGTLSDQQRADLFVADLVRGARAYVAGKGRATSGAKVAGTRLSATLADDLARQEKWLMREAKERGYKDIEDLLEKNYPVFEKLSKLWSKTHPGETLLSRGAAGPEQNTAERSEPPPPQGPWQSLKERVNDLISAENVDKFLYEFQDKLIDLKRLRDHIKALGGTINDLNDAYLGEELYHKRVAKRTEDFLRDELKPLLADMRSRGVVLSKFEEYLHARHAPEANKEMASRNPNQAMIDAGVADADAQVTALELALQKAQASGSSTAPIEKALDQALQERKRWQGAQAFKGTEEERTSLSGMTDGEAAAVMAGLTKEQSEHLRELSGRVDAMNGKTMDVLKSYSLIEPEMLDAWKNTYEFYVPLHRDDAHPDSVSHPVGQGFSVKGSASKRRVGSNAKVTNILSHIAMARETALTRGEKNLVMQKLYVMAAQNPDREWWQIDRPPKTRTVDPDTGLVAERVDPNYKNQPNVLVLKIAGKDAAIVFNERNERAARLAASMKNLDAGDLHVVLGMAAKATRWFASVNTQYNPVFGIINFARDTQAALLGLGSTPLRGKELDVAKNMGPALKAIYVHERALRGGAKLGQVSGEWGKLWADMQDAGGTTGYRDLYADPNERARVLEKTFSELERGNASKFAHGMLDRLTDYNESMEGATRLAAYKVALDSGMSRNQAASLAKNITVNFNRKGRQAREIGALYAFFNAAVQGTTRMVEVLKGPTGRKVMLGGVLLGAMNAAIGLAMMGGDDDDDENGWAKIPEFVRERSLVIPLGREDFVAIPLPLGFNVFPNMGRKAVEAMFTTSGKSKGAQLGEMLGMAVNAFNPFGAPSEASLAQLTLMISPTVTDPIASLLANKDWTGKPIYREDTNGLDPTPGHLRTKDTASTPSKLVSLWLNKLSGGTDYRPGAISWTPDQLDYVIGQLTGGVGRELMKLNQTVTAPLTGDELPAHKIPLLGRIYGNVRGPNAESGRFYENVKMLNEVENELRGRMRDRGDVEEFREQEPMVSLIGAGNGAEKQMRQLRKLRERMTREGNAERVEEINEKMGEVMKSLNRKVMAERNSS